ncbi:hypothetical protein HW44_10520 [Nitrosococcus oceani]|nr:hypothetical protein HW44_10520 [Nitrosococcus oceani]
MIPADFFRHNASFGNKLTDPGSRDPEVGGCLICGKKLAHAVGIYGYRYKSASQLPNKMLKRTRGNFRTGKAGLGLYPRRLA